ncbi:uncharacterized protein LOC134705638 [Mytilus trossulus]|uniref:uncharacterized protein LOC134705638 n=1 Tax=Mytilus trossulus TaxID=6551 RepID=UPI0030058432
MTTGLKTKELYYKEIMSNSIIIYQRGFISLNIPSSDIKSATLEVNNIEKKTVYRADLGVSDILHEVQLSPCQKYKVKLLFVYLSGGNYEVDKDFVIGDKPTTPSIAYNEYPLVGNKANFTCISKVQRWPSDNSENLSYKFYWNGESRQPNTIIRRSDTEASVTCQATDDKGQISPSSDIIIIAPYCKPKNIIFQRSKVAVRLNFIEGITMFVVSNPTPNVTWIQNSPYPWTISRVGVNHNYFLQSKIKISKYPLKRQLGLLICNKIGCVKKYVKTVPKGNPEKVKNINVVNIAPYSAYISWYSGFDGGAPQNFSVILESSTDGSRTITVPSEKKDEGDLVLFKINGLSSNAYYNGHIVSCNKYGKTEVEFEFETENANNDLSERETIIYPLIICGIIGIIVVFVIFKNKEKCKDSKRKIRQTRNKETTNTLLMYENASHIPSTKTSADSNKSCSYSGELYDDEKDDTHENDTTPTDCAASSSKGDNFYEEM